MSGSDLIEWCCIHLNELRDEDATAEQRAEFEACVAEIARGVDCTDRLAMVLRAMGQEIEEVRGGFAGLIGLRGGKGAIRRATCPTGVCSRTEDPDAHHDVRWCAIKGAPMPEQWITPS